MQVDERRHADLAQAAGRQELPAPVRWLMRGAAKVMTVHRAPRSDPLPSGCPARSRSARAFPASREAGSAPFDQLVAGGDLGRLSQHDAGRAVALVRQRDGAGHGRGGQGMTGHDEVHVDAS
jgi:hypothetical protein